MKLKLVEKRQETPDATTFIFSLPENFAWKAGQFVHYVLHHRPTDDRGSDRWFTNAAAPFENRVQITTRITQDTGSTFKKKLQSLQIGKSIEISHVSGDFLYEDTSVPFVFIAGGIGITPFRSILAQLDHEGKQINGVLLYANHDNNIVFKDELDALAKKHPTFTIAYILSPQHVDETTVKEYVTDTTKPVFYISGPEPMVDSLGEMLKNMGIVEEHIKQDWFPGYPAF